MVSKLYVTYHKINAFWKQIDFKNVILILHYQNPQFVFIWLIPHLSTVIAQSFNDILTSLPILAIHQMFHLQLCVNNWILASFCHEKVI